MRGGGGGGVEDSVLASCCSSPLLTDVDDDAAASGFSLFFLPSWLLAWGTCGGRRGAAGCFLLLQCCRNFTPGRDSLRHPGRVVHIVYCYSGHS